MSGIKRVEVLQRRYCCYIALACFVVLITSKDAQSQQAQSPDIAGCYYNTYEAEWMGTFTVSETLYIQNHTHEGDAGILIGGMFHGYRNGWIGTGEEGENVIFMRQTAPDTYFFHDEVTWSDGEVNTCDFTLRTEEERLVFDTDCLSVWGGAVFPDHIPMSYKQDDHTMCRYYRDESQKWIASNP